MEGYEYLQGKCFTIKAWWNRRPKQKGSKMPNFPNLDMHQAIRLSTPGLFLALSYYILSRLGVVPRADDVLTSMWGTGGFLFIGFLIDILGIYKIHPAYRLIRRKLFLSLFEIQSEDHAKTIRQRIDAGSHIREAILYMQDTNKLSHLRVEHAIWISLYNIHIITLSISLILLIANIFRNHNNQITSSQYIIYALSAFVFSITSLIAATNRNISYNSKIISSGREIKRTRKRIK
jgi:hypothetical protein